VRSLEAYEKGFQDKTTLLLSPDSDVLKYMKETYNPKN